MKTIILSALIALSTFSNAFANSETPQETIIKPHVQRMKACSVKYQAAKANETLNAVKWPQFYSSCNKELKASNVSFLQVCSTDSDCETKNGGSF